jgi:hypothetical protein
MKKFLKHIFIIVFLFILLIILIKQFVIKEGNVNELLEQAQTYRTKSSQNYTQSQEYHELGNEAENLAKSYLNQANDAESSAYAERELEQEIQDKALRDEQLRIEMEELQKMRIIEEAYLIKENEKQRQMKVQKIQTILDEARSQDETIKKYVTQAGLDLISLRNTIRETQTEADDLQKQSNMAKERDQENWNELSNDLANQMINVHIRLNELIEKWNLDNDALHEMHVYSQYVHSEFLNLQKEANSEFLNLEQDLSKRLILEQDLSKRLILEQEALNL